MATGSDDSEDLPFQPEPRPRHIAIIMDGNGRWARARGRSRIAGHQAGAESVRAVVRACGAWNIPYLTLYAFSSENWRRPKAEVSALMQLLKRYLSKELKELDKNHVRLNAIGALERLPGPARKQLDNSIDALAGNTGLTLTLALSYGSRDEILRAMKSLAADAEAGRVAWADVGEEELSARLDTAGLPDPDLVIRTAGEQRLSNFLLWQASYAEFYFTDICWPEFREDELAAAIREYQGRLRKFGKTPEQVTETR